jgi:hypothetical protein
MPVHLDRVAAALSAYPWTPGTLTTAVAAPRYCAVGALLRYAGVAQDHIACADGPGGAGGRLWLRYGRLLAAEYGIDGPATIGLIMAANDTARSHAEATERVLGVLSGALNSGAIARLAAGAAGQKAAADAAAAWGQEPDDDAGALALLP